MLILYPKETLPESVWLLKQVDLYKVHAARVHQLCDKGTRGRRAPSMIII